MSAASFEAGHALRESFAAWHRRVYGAPPEDLSDEAYRGRWQAYADEAGAIFPAGTPPRLPDTTRRRERAR